MAEKWTDHFKLDICTAEVSSDTIRTPIGGLGRSVTCLLGERDSESRQPITRCR